MSSPSSLSTSADAALLTRLRAGDVHAFEQLFHRYSVSVFRFAWGATGDRTMAEDLTQEVFAWVWAHRHEWNPGGPVLGYLIGAVRNRIVSHARHERTHMRAAHHALQDGTSLGSAHTSPSPDHAAEYTDQAQRLWAIIRELGEPRQTILLLRWQEELDWETIAQVTGLTVAAAKMQHSRALGVLRERLPESFV